MKTARRISVLDMSNCCCVKLQKYGGIDVVVSNAAVNPSVETILETKESVMDKLWEINVKSSILVIQV